MYSRGKAHVLRLAVSIHLFLEFWELYHNGQAQEDENLEDATDEPNNEEDTLKNRTAADEDGDLSTEADEDGDLSEPEDQEDDQEQCVLIGTKPIEAASSIVSTCLTQL